MDDYKRDNMDLKFSISSKSQEAEHVRQKMNDLTASVVVLTRENQSLVNENRDILLKNETQKGSSGVEFEIMSLKKYSYSFA